MVKNYKIMASRWRPFLLLKIVVYLNNVSKKKGPWCLDNSKIEFPPKKILKNKGPKMRVEDEDMEKFVKRQHWKSLTGKKFLSYIFDYSRNISLRWYANRWSKTYFFTYNSNISTNPSWCLPLFELNKLDTKQLFCQRKPKH